MNKHLDRTSCYWSPMILTLTRRTSSGRRRKRSKSWASTWRESIVICFSLFHLRKHIETHMPPRHCVAPREARYWRGCMRTITASTPTPAQFAAVTSGVRILRISKFTRWPLSYLILRPLLSLANNKCSRQTLRLLLRLSGLIITKCVCGGA